MGFHWQWFGVNKTEPGVVEKLIEIRGLRPTQVRRNLTYAEADNLYSKCLTSGADMLYACGFQGWTFLSGTVLFYGEQVVDVAKALGADACIGWAESVSWSLLMEYAKPDGTFRSRSFSLTGDPGDFDVGLVMRTAEQGPLKRDSEGKEEVKGNPLPGEPSDVLIADGERLARVLTAIGVPMEALMNHYGGAWDWSQMREVPGPGIHDRAFTAYIEGAIGEESQGPVGRPRRKLLGRLLGR